MGQTCSDAPRASRATTMLGVGIGCLLALFLILVHRSGAGVLAFGADGWHPFVTGAFAGMALAAIAAALLYAKDPYRPPDDSAPVRLACPVAACLLLAMGWAASCAAGLQPGKSFSIAAMAWSLPAVAVGCGAGLLVLPFGAPFAALNRQAALNCMGCGLLVAAALDCLSLALAPTALPILGAACALAAAAAPPVAQAIRTLRTADDGHAGPRPSSAAATPDLSTVPSATKRLAALAADTWRPVVGAFICLFIFGFTWNIGVLGVQLNAPGIIVFEKIVGLALAGATLLVLSHLRGNRDPLTLLLNVVLPLLVVTFIVRPYLISLDLGSIGLNVLGVARETGFVLFLASAWIALVQSARQRDVSATFAVAVLVAGCGVAGLLGLYGPQFLGGLLNYMGAILFTLYLVIVVVASTASQHAGGPASAPPSPNDPAPDLGRLVEERCGQVAREHGLTPREGEIVLYQGRGHSYAYIANALTVSENTVRTHVRNIYRKLGVTSREELLAVVHGEDGSRE